MVASKIHKFRQRRSRKTVRQGHFPLPHDRQQEVERITSGRDPAVGYALFAMLATHEDYGPRSNVVLTTNFDDLVADSLYLLTRRKPLVVAHESLAAFARVSRQRPLVVKMHGDARLAPRNTIDETQALDPALAARVSSILSGCALVFCGYAGNDNSIAELLGALPPDAFPLGIYWVGSTRPEGALGPWLEGRKEGFHVQHQDFDGLLIQVAERLSLALPEIDRFRELFEGWDSELKQTERRTSAHFQPDVHRAALRLRKGMSGWDAARRAAQLAATDPASALMLYEEAVEADPEQPGILGNYAVFLARDRKDFDRAEAIYERALAADPDHANNLGNYALFLADDRKDFDRAEAIFERALAADPDHANNLGSYAMFLADDRKDFDRAEAIYERALAADPDHANNLGNYSQLLLAQGETERALAVVTELLQRDIPDALRLELLFYAAAHGVADEQSGRTLVRMISAGSRSPGWSFDLNLEQLREEGDARLAFLTALAEVVLDLARPETLMSFTKWNEWLDDA